MAFVDSASNSAGTGASSVSAAYGATPTDGDILLAVLMLEDGPGANDCSGEGDNAGAPDASGATWVLVKKFESLQAGSNGVARFVSIYRKVAASETTATVQFSGLSTTSGKLSKKHIQIIRWNGITNPEFLSVDPVETTTDPHTSITVPSVTPAEDNGFAYGGAIIARTSAPGTSWASFGTYDIRETTSEGGAGSDSGSTAASDTYTTAAAQSDTITSSVDVERGSIAWNVVVQPAAAAGETGAVTEGAEGGETFGAVASSLGSLAEGAEGGDTDAAQAAAGATLTEGALSGEQLAAVAAALSTLSEGASAGEVLSAAAAALASVSEGTHAGDGPTSLIVILAALSAGGHAGEALAALAAAAGALQEGLEAGESWAAQVAAAGALTEGGVGGDSFSGTTAGSLSGALNGGSEAGETFVAAVLALASMLEGAQAGEQLSALVDAASGLTAGAVAGDAWVGVAAAAASFLEGVDAGDAIDYVGVEIGLVCAALRVVAALEGEVSPSPAVTGSVGLKKC